MPKSATNQSLARAAGIGEDHVVKMVTAAATLTPADTLVEVLIPAAVGDAYAVTLPPVEQCAGLDFFVYGLRAAGYSNGTVVVQDANDNITTDIASDSMTANYDYVAIHNWGGKLWVIEYEKTT